MPRQSGGGLLLLLGDNVESPRRSGSLLLLLGGHVDLVGVDGVDDDTFVGFGDADLVCVMSLVGDTPGLEVCVIAHGVLGGADANLVLLSGDVELHAAARRQPPPPRWQCRTNDVAAGAAVSSSCCGLLLLSGDVELNSSHDGGLMYLYGGHVELQ